MKQLIQRIDHWQRKRIVVIGDFMLDQYVYGDAERLSPDAPVPVLRVDREEHAPGGASNVCMDLAALRCAVTCIGVTGDDMAARMLRDKLAEAGCDTAGLVADDSRRTTVKRSYIGLAQHRHPQKMFRVDVEDSAALDDATIGRVLEQVQAALAQADVLCIEDYNKGVLAGGIAERVIELANQASVPILVDPAAISDYTRYRGATAITPNRTEAEKATGRATDDPASVRAMATELLNKLELEAVVLTLDRHGALLSQRGAEPMRVPTEARNVYDVTGAGDMVLAMLAAARANGADWLESVQLANVAAGLEVERFGVVPIALDEVHFALLQRHHHELGKVRTLDQLVPEIAAYRKQGKKIAFTNGCFDILHAGHIQVLQGARDTADMLILAVNTDVSISAQKGPQRPIVSQDQRIALLAALQCVDYIILFGDGSGGEGDTPIPLLKEIKPDVLVKGGTYKHDEVVGWEVVESYGGKVTTIAPVQGLSTTNIVERIRAQAD
ncbi:bifunctional heptose 7-phosphate kinase/heptose 1-phosphate adenyltransferase [Planctomycetales bacterium ZRK34]|nr:bifunctional heptose 7-phosphate kinase/heptose 1-phosphate adenyltransferase [Planctomycetales bacterium ZRK34]